MHDNNLRRTTNIKEVKPNASFTHPSLFDWSFLSTLNAGRWFSHSRVRHIPQLLEIKALDEVSQAYTVSSQFDSRTVDIIGRRAIAVMQSVTLLHFTFIGNSEDKLVNLLLSFNLFLSQYFLNCYGLHLLSK